MGTSARDRRTMPGPACPRDARDGSPDRLGARCLAVAVYYVESSLPREQAIEQVLAESGKGLDPEAVRLFLQATNLLNLPKQVREVMLDELQPGMVLANGLHSPHGMLLIGEGQALSPGTIQKIRSQGITVVIIEHDMKMVMGISDRIYVLDHGELIAEGLPHEVRANPLVIEAYLGGGVHAASD